MIIERIKQPQQECNIFLRILGRQCLFSCAFFVIGPCEGRLLCLALHTCAQFNFYNFFYCLNSTEYNGIVSLLFLIFFFYSILYWLLLCFCFCLVDNATAWARRHGRSSRWATTVTVPSVTWTRRDPCLLLVWQLHWKELKQVGTVVRAILLYSCVISIRNNSPNKSDSNLIKMKHMLVKNKTKNTYYSIVW